MAANQFAKGYQEALRDITLSLASQGVQGVREWLLANLADAQYREIVTELVPTTDATTEGN